MAELTEVDVVEIRRFLEGTCCEMKRWLPEPQWRPGWQSEAAREQANQERGPAGPWEPEPVQSVYTATAVYLEAVLGAGTDRAKERPVASPAQVVALVEAITARYRAAVLLAAWCGLRRGEVLGLCREDVDLAAGVVVVRRNRVELRDWRGARC